MGLVEKKLEGGERGAEEKLKVVQIIYKGSLVASHFLLVLNFFKWYLQPALPWRLEEGQVLTE